MARFTSCAMPMRSSSSVYLNVSTDYCCAQITPLQFLMKPYHQTSRMPLKWLAASYCGLVSYNNKETSHAYHVRQYASLTFENKETGRAWLYWPRGLQKAFY